MQNIAVDLRLSTSFRESWLKAAWRQALARRAPQGPFGTLEWLSAWWEAFGRGVLMLLVARRGEDAVAVAPLFGEAGMVYFVGAGGSDYLDLVGDAGDPEVLRALLAAARARTRGFQAFVLHHILEGSRTLEALRKAAPALGLVHEEEVGLPAPRMDLRGDPGWARAAARKKSLVRHENRMRREGRLEVLHLTRGREILPHLEAFFEQHVERWEGTGHASLFREPRQRLFYAALCRTLDQTGWLRFTRLDWNGEPVAFHFGFCYDGSYLWYKPSFSIRHAQYSPGEVLLRQLLLAALEEGCEWFDFGLGDEPFKRRFATETRRVMNVTLSARPADAGGGTS